MIELDNSWVEKYVNNGWIAPLNDYITDEMKAGIIPGLLDKFSSGDQLYGIAWNNDTRFYMYNAAKLQEIGMDHASATWDEALDAYGKLKEKGLVNAAYIDCYNQEWAGATELIFLTASFGGKLLDENGHPVMGKEAKTNPQYCVDDTEGSLFAQTAYRFWNQRVSRNGAVDKLQFSRLHS